ncbi:cold-shock protein [Saccharicrinis sp. FJH54]|uniref:cold-shock protein n=1 Tax=Saccharicrinis sp. FJH54 TaxID=3344665 RepID=UPI0035D49F06
MQKGKVKWYDEIKGFGFIESEGDGDIFVHRTGLDSPFSGLQNDEEVVFDTKRGEKGLVAFNVKLVN